MVVVVEAMKYCWTVVQILIHGMKMVLPHFIIPSGGKKGISVYPWRSVKVTRLLLMYGAIIDAKDNEGRTLLQLALELGRHDMAACLF